MNKKWNKNGKEKAEMQKEMTFLKNELKQQKKQNHKVHLNLSVSAETREKLQKYANEKNTTISQAVTDWIWSQP